MSDLKTLSNLLRDPSADPATIFGALMPKRRADMDEKQQAAIRVERLSYELRLSVADLTVQFASETGKGWVKASQEDIASSYRQLGVLVRAMERE